MAKLPNLYSSCNWIINEFKGKGSCEDHSNLLCGLFLGFGMESYVAIGIKQGLPHSWVITRLIEGSSIKISFWESLEGKKYDSKVII